MVNLPFANAFDGLAKEPFFDVYIDGALIAGVDISVHIHDEAGIGSDSVTIIIGDPDGNIAAPTIKDKTCSVTIGYKNGVQSTFGEYKLARRRYEWMPNQWVISGYGADFNEKAKKQFKRTHKNKTLGDLVDLMAGEMELKPRVSKDFKSIKYKAITQTNETNLSFLTRLATGLGAIAKVGNGYLIFVERGQGKNAAGEPLVPVVLGDVDFGAGCGEDEDLELYFKSAKASYTDRAAAKVKWEKFGDGKPEFKIGTNYPNKAAAKAAAKAKFNNKKREMITLSLSIEGNPFIIAETPLITTNSRLNTSQQWIVRSVDHSINGGGFRTNIKAEMKV